MDPFFPIMIAFIAIIGALVLVFALHLKRRRGNGPAESIKKGMTHH